MKGAKPVKAISEGQIDDFVPTVSETKLILASLLLLKC